MFERVQRARRAGVGPLQAEDERTEHMDRYRRFRVFPVRRLRVGGAIVCAALLVLGAQRPLAGASPVAYRFTFPEPEHHWMQVDATFPDLDSAPLELRMSRSSPGRYSLHDFAKNVYDVSAVGPDGRALVLVRPDPYGWTIATHPASVTVRYKVFGDRVDGTYLAVDTTHAHINMPSAVMWARGLDDRAAALTFVPPAGVSWKAATQLHPGSTPFEFTAPNLQYLMDSPIELGPLSIQQFVVGGRTFRFAAHQTGTAAELNALVKDVEKIVRVEGAIFGEYPVYEPGTYTFLADYLPYADGDGMEHRNSTVITSSSSIRTDRGGLLDTVAHEFFHCWNVERIRPRSLEPFDFERANMSGALWLAEGFTQYYGPLAQRRAGLIDLRSALGAMNGFIQTITVSPGRQFRSAEEMSQMAPFTDGGRTVDRTNWASAFISYYPFGGAIALGLDLSLRGRSDGRISLDDFMRAMWRAHGTPTSREGYVDHPYTLDDAEQRLAEVSGDAPFAHDFFRRFVHGREEPDYATLLRPAGVVLRRANLGRPWWGDVRVESRDGVRLAAPPLANTPLYKAGLDVGDELRSIDRSRITAPDELPAIVGRHKPGDTLLVEVVDRGGRTRTARVTLEEDPRVETVPVEETGGTLTSAQKAFRAAWLGRD
jgi:predicted metalloprotease with PDZ domain